jgi:hypothetical protein
MSKDTTGLEARLNKPNQALVIKPEKGKLAGNGLKLHLALLFKSQQQMLATGEGIPNSDYMFEAAVIDLMGLINVSDSSDIRQSLKGYFIEMMSTVVRWESPDANKSSTVIWAGMPMLSFAKLELREGKLWAIWQLPGPLLKAIADPTLYTPLDLLAVSRLSSYSAIALYQICARYRHNPSGVTSKNTPDWWLDAMISTPAIDQKTKKRIIREWRKKKNAIVIPAIQEINTLTDIEVELIEFRENAPGAGKSVTGVQFTVKKKRNSVPIPKIAIDMEIVRMCIKLNIPQIIVDSYAKTYSDEQIKTALYKLESRMGRTDLDIIDKPVTYFSKILRDEEAKQKVEISDFVVRTTIQELVAKGDQDQYPVELISAFTRIKIEFQNLDIEVQRTFAEKAFIYLQNAGLSTASMSRNMSQNVWNGILLPKMLDMYGEETYGPEWKTLTLPVEH